MKVFQVRQFITRWGLRPEQVRQQAAGKYGIPVERFRIRREALDVRGKRPRAVYTLEVSATPDVAFLENRPEVGVVERTTLEAEIARLKPAKMRPLIVGMGPAGLFAAMTFLEAGVRPILLERGKPVEERVADVARLWRDGHLDPNSNPLFGEGGAGTFSDGKLTTRVNDPLTEYVLEKLASFGAKDRILTDAKPHVGTDRLVRILKAMREWLDDHGADIHFQAHVTCVTTARSGVSVTCADGRTFSGDGVLLAIGHSARDTYAMLREHGLAMEPKPFAVGARIEHPQEQVDRMMYGRGNRTRHGLPPASYQLAWNGPDGTGCYTFCMCPGGEVILAVHEAETLCVNGMSHSKRNSPFANAALLGKVPVAAFHQGDVLDGVAFQRKLEQCAYRQGVPGFMAPVQRATDFLSGQLTRGNPATSYRNGSYAYPIHEILPAFVVDQMRQGLRQFHKRVRGFVSEEAVLIGIETRTSAPVRLLRDRHTRCSLSHPRVYPCGEGAGYAGGIMSAALDGIRTALHILQAR